MTPVLSKFKIIFLIFPIFLIILYIILKIVYFPLSDGIIFVDYFIFRTSFRYYPLQIYDYYYFLYTPQFFLEFYWIKITSFEIGLIIWFIIKAIIITIIWRVFLYNKGYNSIEIIGFLFLVLVLGMSNEIFTANTDIILLGCGFGSYLILVKAENIVNNTKSSECNSIKSKYILILNFIAGFILAWGMFKILLLIYLPILIYKSNNKKVFLSAFCLWLLISNYLFFIYPVQLFQFIEKIKSGQTIVDQRMLYKTATFNMIWRSGFAAPRIQIHVYPAIVCYLNNFIKKESSKNLLIITYIILYPVFHGIGFVLFVLGF